MKALSSCDRTSLDRPLFPKCITLQATRLSHSVSRHDIQEKTGINEGYIYQFEQGKCKPWPAAIAKLCSLFEVAQLDLFPELEESRKSCEPPYPPCKTLKAARQDAGLSQFELAFKSDIGISPQYISMFEKGHRKPWVSVSEKLCAYFELTQDELFPELVEWTDEYNDLLLSDRIRKQKKENHYRSKLTEIQVLKIRDLGNRYTRTQLGKMFGVSPQAISDVLRGISWPHIKGDDQE